MTLPVEIILLAAGQSRRMRGKDKLLETVRERPLLTYMAEQSSASDARKTHVVVPAGSTARRDALKDLDVSIIDAEHAADGMSASLKAGLEALPKDAACLIVLADMPEIAARHLNQLIATYQDEPRSAIIRATDAKGTPGNPVLFGPDHVPDLMALTGDQGARDILKTNEAQTIYVELDGDAARLDLDTPEAWATWRATSKT